MAKERLKSPRARLFVALDLPERVREGLVAWQREALTDPALRPVAAEALHVTLCFLAYQPERDDRADRRGHALGRRAAGGGRGSSRSRWRFRRTAPACSRSTRRARRRSRSRPSSPIALEAERFYKPEKRPFWPHVTVARIKPSKRSASDRRGRRRGRPMRVEAPPGPLPAELWSPLAPSG